MGRVPITLYLPLVVSVVIETSLGRIGDLLDPDTCRTRLRAVLAEKNALIEWVHESEPFELDSQIDVALSDFDDLDLDDDKPHGLSSDDDLDDDDDDDDDDDLGGSDLDLDLGDDDDDDEDDEDLGSDDLNSESGDDLGLDDDDLDDLDLD